MRGQVTLTKQFANSTIKGGRKSPIYYDDEVIGFGLQVRGNVRETFVLSSERSDHLQRVK